MENIKLERWEADEFIITINDKPVGATVNESCGKVVLEWLKCVKLDDITNHTQLN